jgi:hypothetical protein
MRIIFVLAASALLGIAIAVLLVQPGAAAGEGAMGARAKAASSCGQSLCESKTWLRLPVMRRASPAR